MSILGKLNFVDASPVRRVNGDSPLDKFLAAVERQIAAAETIGNGEQPMTAEGKPQRTWFFEATTGEWCVAVRYGNRPLKITDDGKHSVLVGEFEKILPTLKLIKKAAEAGELTDAINEAQKIGGRTR